MYIYYKIYKSMRRGRIHGEKNMRNSRTKTQTKLRNYIKLTAGALLLAITFVLVFAGTLSGAFGIENELQQNGIIQSNVASAAVTNKKSSLIDLSATLNAIGTSYNINPDPLKRGKFYTTKADNAGGNNWTTTKWTMGSSSGHTGTDYAHCWIDYDLGDWLKLSDRIDITVSVGAVSMSKGLSGGIQIGGYFIAIDSSDTQFQQLSNASSDGSNYYDKQVKERNDIDKSSERPTGSFSVKHTIKGRYIRIYLVSYSSTGDYGTLELSNVSVDLTRTKKSYSVSYDKNADSSTGTVANTSHKYMAASNITSDFYVGNGQYFTGWNTSANGLGIAMAIGASTGTSTAANTFGNVVRSNLQNGQTTTTLYAQYQGISFTFNGKDYTQYNNEVLQVLQGRGGYLTHTVDSSYSTVVSYRNSNGSEIAQPITIGVYSAIIEVSKDGKTRGTVTLPFEIIEGDFGKIQGGTGKWGSVTNPYVISNETHLKNLSAIVNGRDALNSIVGSDGVTAEQVVATDKTYKDCYFVVAADLGAGTAIELVPIGKDSTHYFAGTIFGGNDSDATNRTQRTIYLNVSQSGVDNVGLFGYVKGATISHLTTAGTIVGGAAVGGLVGYADGVTISNCRNNATVKALGSAATFGDTQGAYLGGFVGYATASVTIKNCYNGGEITTETSWPHSNIVGGIVGHLGTGGEVSYCYNKGKVVGSDNIGGIVGINNGTVSYCYQDGELNDLYLGTSPSNFITSNGGAIEHCWILPGASQTGFNQDTTPNGKQLELFDINGSKNNKMYDPVVVDGNTYYPVPTGNWKSIVEKDINGFEVFVADTNGNKSLLQKGEYLRSAKATPTIINSNATANKLGHTRQDSTTIDIVYVYSATVGNDVFVSHSRIGKTVSNTTYNGQNQDIGNIANLPTNTAASVFYFEKGNAASTATSAKKDWREGGYVVVVDIKIGDKVVGRDVFDWIINKKTLTVEYKWTQDLYNNGSVVYNGAQQGLTSFEIKGFVANESVESGNATVALTYTNTDYTLVGSKYTLNVDKSTNEGQYGVSFTLEANNYALDTNATHAFSWTISRKSITIGQSSFYYGTNIEQKLTDGTVFQNLVSGHSVRVDTQKHNFYKQNIGNNQYTILQSDITVNDNSGQPVTGNYNITGGVIITVLAGDFWSNGTTDIANNPWGSPHNPYVIGTKEQLTRLSAIVGGTSAVNSIKNDTYVYVQAQSGDYSGAYFKLADNIPSVGNITPIGSNTHSFAGNFDGNNKTISGLNISVAGNNVGLFGYISGATIKNLTVNGSVKGSQYVGGVVGYALNSTIENVTNNASVSTHQSQSAFNVSYTIKQKDGTEGNSNEGWDKINDNNDSTKYCASNSKTSLSFIIDLGSPITAWGFAIFNGGDTNKYPDRRPNEIYIWGSNSNSNAAFPSDSVGKNNSGNTPSGKGLSDYWTSVYSQSGVIGTSVTTRYEIGFPSIQSYRYYWVYLKSYGQQIQFAEFDILHAGDSIGGVVGYASGTNIKNATNNENIVGGNYSGGIVGQISASSTQYTITDSKNIGSISGNDGTAGIVGGIASGGYVKISACENSGNISGGENSNGVAGIIGHTKSGGANRLVVDGCKNTGTISGGRNVGGIGGRIETTRNNKDSIVFTNCYNDKNITAAKYGTVGGIVGYLYANGTTTVDVATISYCFSSGIMSTNATASSNVGGIVGNPNANSSKTSTRIFNCYTTNTTQGISGTSNATVDATNYVITSGTTAPTINNGGSYLLYDSFSSKPVVINNGTFTPFDSWADITKNDFNGFKVVGSVAKNEFFCSDNGSDTNTKYVKPSKTEGFAGDNGDVTTWYSATIASNIRVRVQNITLPTIGSKEYDGLAHGFGHTTYPNTANGAAANNPIVYTTEFLYVGTTYKENLNVSPTNVDVYNTTVTIKIDGQIVGVKKGDTVTITERLLKVSNVWTSASEHVAGDTSNVYIFHYNTQHQGIIENGISVVSVHGEFAIPQDVYTIGGYVETKQAHNDTTHTRTFTLNDIRNYKIENKYSQYDDFSPNTVLTEDTSDRGISEATVGDTIVVTYTWKIVPYSLATNITSGNVWFGGRTDLIVGNQGIANVNVGNQSYADKRFYPLQSEQNGVQKVLVYAQHNYAADKFVLYVKYNNGTVAVLTQGTEYTLSALDAPTVENPTPLNTSVTASGTGNFSGNITKYYTAMFSDFGWKDGKTPEDNDWGGSAKNPYVISKPEHLLRLSQIVNGGMAWNSIQNTVTAGVCIAPQTTAKATSRDYNDAYFLVTVDIDMSGYISTDGVYNFLPIGHRNEQSQTDMPFSGTFDGNGKKIKFVYNVNRNNFYNNSKAHSDYVGLFGYIAGYKVDAEQKYATIKNLSIESMDGNEVDDKGGIIGKDYVGGIAGYAVDSKLYNVSMMYGGWVRGENYVGGIVGYADNTWLKVEKDYGNAITYANVGGETYVGGIVGKWIVRSEDQIGGDAAGQAKITLPSGQQIHGVKYVGGIAGWMDTSSCATTISYAPQLNNNGEKVGVYGTEYVGALFGALIGNGYHKGVKPEPQTGAIYTAIGIDSGKVNNITLGTRYSDGDVTYQSKVVGGLVGYVESAGLVFVSDWNTANIAFDLQNVQDAALSFFGGVVGVLGQNATMEALYEIKADGTFLSGGMHTITNNTELGASGNLMGSFVGGIVGYVSSQAGVYWETGTTIFGNGISLVNSATIYATSYAGGIFGALGDLSTSVAQTFENDTNSILYNVLTTGVRSGNASTTLGLAPTVSGNGITAQGRLVNNASISVSGSYVGGIAGYGGAKVRFVLRNTPQDSAIDVSKLNIYSGGSDIFINGSYAGGIAGYLVDNLEHDLQYIVVKARFNTNNQSATRVGGLVGYMGSGNVQNCVVTNGGSSAITASTDTYQGSEYVGGLVGETQNATIRNSVSTGFNLEKTSNTKGGLLGGGTNPTIESSWTFYIANSGATYSTVSKNTYGKYILVDTDIVTTNGSSYPTFENLCGFAGIASKQGVTKGVLEFDVNMPRYDLNANLNNKQLAFYDASGSDTVSTNFDSGAVNGFENKVKEIENINNVVTTKLDMASGTSMQICVVKIEFVNISNWNSTNPLYNTTNGAQKNVENAYKKPSNSSRYVVDATNNNDGTIATNPKRIYDDDGNVRYILANVYFNWQATDGTVRYVPIGSSNTDYVSDRIGTYDSEVITPGGSAENPLTISSQEEWNDFAWSIYTGANDYEGKYVKLLKNITIEKKTEHKGTKVNHNFASVSTPNSYSEADPKNANSNMGYNFAGNISQGNSDMKLVTVDGVQGTTTPSFKGHFDGNGNKIKISVNENVGTDYYHRMSAFPNAGINASSKTTFKNLTIYGTIIAGDATAVWDKDDMPWTYNSAYDIAGFVGKPFGAIKFENCTAQVNIKGLRLIAGFAGGSTSTAPIELVGCVNKGDITSYQHSIWTTGTLGEAGYPKDFEYGTGGLIGYATNDITIDSCLNTGDITGETKVGGLVGRVTAKTTIINSANIGKVLAKELNPHYLKLSDNEDRNRKLPTNAWGRAGGIVGEASKTATLQMFACYNTGEIRTWSNVVGGLVGIVGTIPDDKKPHSAEANNKSTIAYCYNKGNIIAGYHQNLGNVDFGTSGINFNGTDAGGIVGVAVRLDINYCYNTGDVATYGLSTQVKSYQVRMGGILAEAATGDPKGVTGNGSNRTTKDQLDVCINDCYTTGTLHIEENHNTSNTSYGANIIGYLQGTNNQTSNLVQANRCYGVASSIKSYKDEKIVYYSGWNNAKGGDIQYVRTGTTLNSLSDLTAIMRSDGSVKPRAFYYANNQNNEVELWNASTSTIGAQNDANYKNGTLGGYVYVYGCLPQLAVFAVDTYNGLSMNSQNFGKDIYGEYKAQKAGEKYSPYVIRDGIDLMGVQTLVGLGYTFADKYIEFANGSNNITLDKNLSSDVAKAINMPTTNESNSGGQKIKDTDYAYMASSDGTTYNQIGKSYHLFKQGAVCKDDNNSTANNAYQTWVGRTYYYDGAYNYVNDWANNATFKVQNMLSIGRNGNVFKGSISGKQENNDNPDKPVNTVINNLRIMTGKTNGGAYAGLFGHIEDAYVGYIEVGGESNIWSFSYNNSDISVAGGVVAYMTGGSVVEHCVLSGTASVGVFGIDDKTNITTLSKPDFTYAGGIVGLADTKQGDTYNAGIVGTIKDCIIDITTANNTYSGIISGSKSNIGGVLGYIEGIGHIKVDGDDKDYGASGKSNSVRIEGCEVQKAAIQAASSATESSHIGGVLGYGSEYVAAFITGCKVGNGADTVTIKGEHSLGGIAGGMSNAKGGYIDSCIVGEKATIERINQGGDKDDNGDDKVSESPKHGTAIGGLVGFTQDSKDDTSPLTTTFSGTSAFGGTITVSVESTNKSQDSDAKISCIGGIVGDMGSGASFASGSDVTVGGTIDIKNSQGDWLAAANVGGVAGRTSNATFIGKFDVSPTMNTTEAENVGGFIGKNVGTVYILADTTERIVDGKLNGTNITIGGTIQGTSEVGGFIGVNNSGSTLNIGSNVANAKAYKSGTLSIIIAEGATISGSGNHVGGIVGKNEGAVDAAQKDYATIDIVKGTIVQNGTISGKNYVGGIIGLNAGLLTTGGGEADESIGGVNLSNAGLDILIKNLSIANKGNVKGGTTEKNQYVGGDCVGGVIGWLDAPQTLRSEHIGKGDIAGTFKNNGSVEGNRFVGGSLGYVGKYVNIATKGGANTLFVNTGNVTAHSTFVGGSIGAIVGKITGAKVGTTVNFENTGTVNGLGYVGGSIGVLAGQTQFAQFVNSPKKDFTIDACNSVGGSVGYIGMPDALKAVLDAYFEEKDPTYSDIDITVKNVHFEASGNLTANPTDATLAAAKDDGKGGVVDDNDWGGVGGAIGVLGRNQLATWENNTYYANGNVIAQNVNNVGGIIGLINANDITIGNLLAYNITVTGAKNVGGIVGATDGIGTVITSAYAIEGTFTGSKNVGGIIGLAKTDTDASTSYWVKGYANSDIATYDVKDLSKLGFTTGKATTGWFFLYANDANDATGANGLGTINTNHQGGGEIELKYWKRIANAYTAQERADGDDKKTIAPPSGIVSGGQPIQSTLYATATAAEVTEKGYYMYTATSNNDVKPSVIYDNGVYYISVKTNVINAEDEKVQAQNVAVFYRSVSSSKEALIYNGYLRNAIIGLDGVDLYENLIGDNETPTINGYKGQYIFTATTTIKNADGSTSEVNEAQSDPNTYSSVIKIYYVDDNGTARLVGGNTELAWKITERELAVAFEHTTNRTYGTGTEDNTTDMTVTIDNIAPKRGVTVPIRIVVSYGTQEDSRVIFTWDGTKFNGADENIKLTSLPMTPSGTLSDKDKESTSETIEDEATYQLVVKLFFKQAKSYTITVLDSSQKARYTFKKNGGSASAEVSDEFTVLPAPLTLRRGDNVAASSAYDGTAKGTAWVVEGFKYNDGIQQFSEFAPSFNIAYKNSGAITKAMTAENMTTGVDFNGPRVTVSGPTGGDLTITLSSAIKKGDYYLSFGKYKAGNYVLTADDSVRSYSIVEIQITISCADNGKSKVYNGQTQTIEISFVASVPSGSGITDFEGIENFAAFISEFFNIKEGDFTVTKPSNTGGQKKEKEVKWTITTGKNAKEYKFEFEKGNKYNEHIQNCSHKPETLPTYKYTITRRPLTLTTTLTEMPNGASQYTYNTSHQGLSKIKVDNLVANDTIGVTIKIGTQSATVELENNNAKDVTDKVSTIDAGTYSVSFALSTNTSYPQNENYTLTATDVTWKIDKYKIMIGEFEIGAEKTYNAEAEVPKINVTNSEVSVSGNTFTYGTDTFTLEYAVSYNNQTYASNNLVNAGTYKIKIGTSNGKIHAKHSDGNDASNNYEFGNSSTEHQYVINPCEIKIGWEKKTFVYNASNWKLNVASIEINNKTKTVTNNRVQTGLGNDTLTFSRGGGGIDVGSYTTVVTSHSVSVEPNHGVRPIAGNYKIVSGATSGEFTITPFVVNISFNTSAGAILNKVYNANEDVPKEQIKDSYFTWSKISGTNLPSSNPFTITGKYYDKTGEHYDKNVGTGKCVMFTYTFTDPSGKGNYKAGTVDTAQHNVGQITPAHIKVALDKLRSGKATRTFTNKPYYGGENGASSGEKDGKSTVYRSGEGFTVSGVLSSDAIKVVAEYREADDSRNGTGNSFDLSSYVNDVVKNKDGTFDMAEAGTHYFKTLVFTMTGTDAKNYTFNVYNKLGTDGKKYSEKDSTAGDTQTITVYDSRDTENKHQNASGAEKIQIEITVKTYKVEYTNAAQSYANADNTYNTNWERVGVSNNPPGVTVTVSNGWMYADGQDHGDDEQAEKKVYKAYTTIRGSQNSVRLGAKISGIDGMELNYKMVNQPILTIGYFVVDNNDVFEIGSASSLMIASYYWWVAQNGQNPDFNLPLVATSTWHKIVSNDDYMTKPFEKPSDAPNNVDMSKWDWDMYFAWFEQQNNVKIFLNETGIPNEDGTWGYYTTGEESQKKQYTKYRMVRDFSGKLSESDIAILEAFFPKEKGWGVGKTYLDNFLNTSVGSVLTAVGSVFRWYNGSVGQFEFDGNGYVIEYLNIMGYGKENVGLFDIIGANGIVKNLHLRNITINANKGNVGGIAGSIAAAEGDADATKNVTNVSFHGKITATGGTVGGLFGTSARAIDGAIVLGEISATNAIVGGVVGTATAGLNNVVSMMQITASGGTVGAFTSDNANVGEKCTHMTKAVWKKGTSGTGFVNVKDKNVGYNALMSGSNSLYANGTSDLGTYDVISETFADSGQNVNPRQSKRLRDMVSVYLLMYSLSANGGTYTISSSSWLVGTADGTNAKPIVIANKQNVSLLRELRFAAFVLKANVSIDIASTFSGAFYGSVTSESGKDYKITCNKQMFEEYATTTQAWLKVKP